MRIIAFAGPKGSGKDTAAAYLLGRNTMLKSMPFRQLNFADTLKLSVELIFGYTPQELNDPALKEADISRWPNKKPREILQNFANLLRTLYAPDIWVRAWERRVKLLGDTNNCIVVTDLRHIEEVDKLREFGAKIIYIRNPTVEKIRAEGIAKGEPLWCDSSEALAAELQKQADIVVDNDGQDLRKLQMNVHQAMLTLYPEWRDWQELSSADLNSPVLL